MAFAHYKNFHFPNYPHTMCTLVMMSFSTLEITTAFKGLLSEGTWVLHLSLLEEKAISARPMLWGLQCWVCGRGKSRGESQREQLCVPGESHVCRLLKAGSTGSSLPAMSLDQSRQKSLHSGVVAGSLSHVLTLRTLEYSLCHWTRPPGN